MIRVVIVEDSVVVQEFLKHILNSDLEIQVVGIANNGEEALELVREKKPDIITMDIYMPKMDGFETTRRIMETIPTPIVVVSASDRVKETAYASRLFEAGALAVTLRPPAFDDPGHKAAVDDLLQTVKLMAEVKVVKRIQNLKSTVERSPAIKAPQEGKNIQLTPDYLHCCAWFRLRTLFWRKLIPIPLHLQRDQR